MIRPGTATDRFKMADVMTVRTCDAYEILETPSRRDFWFGNVLFLDAPPSPNDYDRLLSQHAEIFEGTGVRAHVVQWETNDAHGDAGVVERNRAEPSDAFEQSRVLELRTFVEPEVRSDYDVRPLASDSDWEAAIALDEANRDDEGTRDQDAFQRWRIGRDRAAVADGRARTYGAFDAGTLVAYAGLYANARWMRATTPHTALALRQRGLFSLVFARAYVDARASYPTARCIIAAEAGGGPERAYRSFGFVPIGTQSAVVRRVI